MTTKPVSAKPAKAVSKKAKGPKVETLTIVQIAEKAGRSPKVLRAIARNEAYRASQGLAARLPAPVTGQRHTYKASDVPAFLEAIKKA